MSKAEESLTEMRRRLEELQRSNEDQIKHLEAELSQAWSDRDAAAREWSLGVRRTAESLFRVALRSLQVGVPACELDAEVCISAWVLGAVEELVASHKVVLQEQQVHTKNLEEKEKLLKQEV